MIYRTMNDGNRIPALGFGTFQMTSAEVFDVLPAVIGLGCTHIDTANRYFNEVAVGEAIKRSGVPRENLFVTSKLFPPDYPHGRCLIAIDETLRRLGLDYLDLMLFHQPYGDYVDGWQDMEEAVRQGKVRSIGVDNFSAAKVREVMAVASIAPAAIQVEMNPHNNRHALKRELADLDLTYEGWYPLGHGDPALLAEPAIAAPAERHDKTPAQVVIRWHMQEGNVVFPKSLNLEHVRQNFDVFDFELDADEMAAINALEQRPYHKVLDECPAWMAEPQDYSKQA